MEQPLDSVYEGIMDGDIAQTPVIVQTALDAGIAPDRILNEGMISAMTEVGRLFESGDYYVPEMLISARAMKAGLEVLQPYLVESGVKPIGKVVIGTVQGDLHDIGKNLVSMMLEGAGFEVMDLGTDVDPTKFAEAVRNGANVVGMSALLTTTMGSMADVIEAVEDINMRDKVKIIIGGAPVTPEYAEQIGADGFAADASSAVKKVRELLA